MWSTLHLKMSISNSMDILKKNQAQSTRQIKKTISKNKNIHIVDLLFTLTHLLLKEARI